MLKEIGKGKSKGREGQRLTQGDPLNLEKKRRKGSWTRIWRKRGQERMTSYRNRAGLKPLDGSTRRSL